MDDPRWLVGEIMKLRGGAMAERRRGPRPQQDAPEHSLATRRAGERGIDAVLEPLPATGTQLVVDDRGCQADPERLRARHDTGLAFQELQKAVRWL